MACDATSFSFAFFSETAPSDSDRDEFVTAQKQKSGINFSAFRNQAFCIFCSVVGKPVKMLKK